MREFVERSLQSGDPQQRFDRVVGHGPRDHHLVVLVDLIAEHGHGLGIDEFGHDEDVGLFQQQPGQHIGGRLSLGRVIVDRPDVDHFVFMVVLVLDRDEVAHVTVGR